MFGLQRRKVLVYGRQRCKFQTLRDLFIARAVAVFADKALDEIEHLFLSARECHSLLLVYILGEEKEKCKLKWGKVFEPPARRARPKVDGRDFSRPRSTS